MKFQLKKAQLKNLKPLRVLKFLPAVILVLLLTLFGLTITFLYKYFYETVTQVKIVSILRSQVALNQVNIPLYQKVIDAWETKKQFDPAKLENLRDPFRPLDAAAPSGEAGPSLEEANLTQ